MLHWDSLDTEALLVRVKSLFLINGGGSVIKRICMVYIRSDFIILKKQQVGHFAFSSPIQFGCSKFKNCSWFYHSQGSHRRFKVVRSFTIVISYISQRSQLRFKVLRSFAVVISCLSQMSQLRFKVVRSFTVVISYLSEVSEERPKVLRSFTVIIQ